jgi:DNA-binding response OmpR family regulator
MRALLIEDNDRLAAHVAAGLASAGFAVDRAASAADADAMLDPAAHDIVLLDLGLPDGDGLAWLKRRRAGGLALPVIAVTARGQLGDRVQGLDSGADDYLVKPFEMAELTARCRALLRRPGATLGTVLTAGAVSLDTAAREARVGGRAIDMPRREIDCLEVLLRRAGQVVPRPALEERLYAFDDEVTPNALEAVISRLRRRLADAGSGLDIHTVRGIGYLAREKAPRREGR